MSRTVGAKLYSLTIGVLTLMLTARWLGPDGRGEYAAVLAWASAFVGIAHCSLAEVASQRLSGHAHEERFRSVAMALVYACLALSGIAWLVALLLWHLRPEMFGQLSPGLLALALAYLPWMIWEIYGTVLLVMSERIVLGNISLVLGRTVSITCVLLAVAVWDFGIVGVLLAGLAGQIVISSGGIWLVWRRCAQYFPSWSAIRAEFKPLLSGSARLHLNALGAILLNTTGTLMIASTVGVREAGFFQLAQQLMNILLVVSQSASQVLYGRQGTLGPDGVWRLQRKMILLIVLLTMGMGLMVALSASYWLPWVAGPGYESAAPLLLALVPVLVFLSFSSIMASQWIGRGLFLSTSIITLTVGGVNLLVSSILIPKIGIMGAVYGQMFALAIAVFTNGGMALWCERRFRQHRVKVTE
ncbi:hypothetical protein BXU06_12160 [Aquaspirillum sp. LM1]|uniref:lipopolysaccharide biosynthesis protein n=1 Tax=Aquaspirillum sp. LM1 TaxID=1938604 RepID=UPI000983C8D0|nr:lipopolysaccharide biosynthesis protein [Aquaspirillum sp. LM1]AQR65719.1 hypothetical protein BXU06_12160 [Aquaspirillum sp. LM1]